MSLIESGDHNKVIKDYIPTMIGDGLLRVRLSDGREMVSVPDKPLAFQLVDQVSFLRQGNTSLPVVLDLDLTTHVGETDKDRFVCLVLGPTLVSEDELIELYGYARESVEGYQQLFQGGADSVELTESFNTAKAAAELLLAANGWNGQWERPELRESGLPLDNSPVGVRERSGGTTYRSEKAAKVANTATRIAAGVTIGLTVGAAIDNAILTENEIAREVVPSNAIQKELDVSILIDSNVSAEITGFSTNIDLSERGKDGVSPFVEQSVGKILSLFADKANAQEDQSQTIWVRAEKGDTAASLALRCRTSVAAIEVANGWDFGSASWRFQAGKLVKVPCKSDILNHNPRAGSNSKVAVPSYGNIVGSRSGRSTGEVVTGASSHLIIQGETLSQIAGRYGRTVEQLAAFNGITNPSHIYAGSRINIPDAGYQPPKKVSTSVSNSNPISYYANETQISATSESVQNPASYFTWKVSSNMNIGQLAQHLGTSIEAIRAANPNDLSVQQGMLKVGMTVKVPIRSLEKEFKVIVQEMEKVPHKVIDGDTLSSIAIKYNTTLYAIGRANNIESSVELISGQEIQVPIPSSISEGKNVSGPTSDMEGNEKHDMYRILREEIIFKLIYNPGEESSLKLSKGEEVKLEHDVNDTYKVYKQVPSGEWILFISGVDRGVFDKQSTSENETDTDEKEPYVVEIRSTDGASVIKIDLREAEWSVADTDDGSSQDVEVRFMTSPDNGGLSEKLYVVQREDLERAKPNTDDVSVIENSNQSAPNGTDVLEKRIEDTAHSIQNQKTIQIGDEQSLERGVTADCEPVLGGEEIKIGDDLILANSIVAETTFLVKDKAGEVVKGDDGRALTEKTTMLVPEGSSVKVVGEVVDPETGKIMKLLKLLEDTVNPDNDTILEKGQIFRVSSDLIITLRQEVELAGHIGGGVEESTVVNVRSDTRELAIDLNKKEYRVRNIDGEPYYQLKNADGSWNDEVFKVAVGLDETNSDNTDTGWQSPSFCTTEVRFAPCKQEVWKGVTSPNNGGEDGFGRNCGSLSESGVCFETVHQEISGGRCRIITTLSNRPLPQASSTCDGRNLDGNWWDGEKIELIIKGKSQAFALEGISNDDKSEVVGALMQVISAIEDVYPEGYQPKRDMVVISMVDTNGVDQGGSIKRIPNQDEIIEALGYGDEVNRVIEQQKELERLAAIVPLPSKETTEKIKQTQPGLYQNALKRANSLSDRDEQIIRIFRNPKDGVPRVEALSDVDILVYYQEYIELNQSLNQERSRLDTATMVINQVLLDNLDSSHFSNNQIPQLPTPLLESLTFLPEIGFGGGWSSGQDACLYGEYARLAMGKPLADEENSVRQVLLHNGIHEAWHSFVQTNANYHPGSGYVYYPGRQDDIVSVATELGVTSEQIHSSNPKLLGTDTISPGVVINIPLGVEIPETVNHMNERNANLSHMFMGLITEVALESQGIYPKDYLYSVTPGTLYFMKTLEDNGYNSFQIVVSAAADGESLANAIALYEQCKKPDDPEVIELLQERVSQEDVDGVLDLIRAKYWGEYLGE